MNDMNSKSILSIQQDIAKEYPDATIPGNINDTPGFIEFLIPKLDEELFTALAQILEGLTRTHPFPDGNKRTALNTTAAIALQYGYSLDANCLRELVKQIAQTNQSSFSIERITNQLNDCASEVRPEKETLVAIAYQYRENNRDIFNKLAYE